MGNKINAYVKYIFKLNNLKDDEMYLEITSNLNERYQSMIKKGLSEEDAYLKTIDTLGDFNFNDPMIDNSYQYKPNWANISLWVSLGLGILATILLFVSTAVSALFTGVSIALYIGSAYYSYHLSQYALKEEKDIEKHNELLKGIFKNLKTTFIFWNINISYWLTKTIMNLVLMGTVGTVPADEIVTLIMLYVSILAGIFIIILIFFTIVYKNIESKYYELTQEEKLKSYTSDFKLFKVHPIVKTVFKATLLTLILAFYIGIIIDVPVTITYSNPYIFETYLSLLNNILTDTTFLNIFIVLSILSGIFSVITFIFKMKRLFMTGLTALLTLHITSIIYLIIAFKNHATWVTDKTTPSVHPLSIISFLLIAGFLVYRVVSFIKEKNQK